MTWTKLSSPSTTWSKLSKREDGVGFLSTAGLGFLSQPFLSATSAWSKLTNAVTSWSKLTSASDTWSKLSDATTSWTKLTKVT